MKKEKFSYTRVSCFQTCKWQYYLKYVKKYKVDRNDNTKLAAKGVAFHEVAEKYSPEFSIDQLTEMMEERAAALFVDPKEYDYREAASRLKWFMDEFAGKSGLSMKREHWVNGTFAGEPVCGALDVMLSGPDEVKIVDFKSGKSAGTDSYRDQLALYAALIGQEMRWNYEETAKKVRCYIFFPLAEIKNKSLNGEERAMEALKEIFFTEEQLVGSIAKFESTIEAIKATDWTKIKSNSAEISFVCSFCQFAGLPESLNKDCFCSTTYNQGVKAPRSVKVYKDPTR